MKDFGIGRSVLAVVAGYIALGLIVSVGQFLSMAIFGKEDVSTAHVVFILIFDTVASLVAGFTTAALSTTQPMRHAWYLVILGLVIGAVSIKYELEMGQPLYYIIIRTALFVPAIWLGAKVQIKRRNNSAI